MEGKLAARAVSRSDVDDLSGGTHATSIAGIGEWFGGDSASAVPGLAQSSLRALVLQERLKWALIGEGSANRDFYTHRGDTSLCLALAPKDGESIG